MEAYCDPCFIKRWDDNKPSYQRATVQFKKKEVKPEVKKVEEEKKEIYSGDLFD